MGCLFALLPKIMMIKVLLFLVEIKSQMNSTDTQKETVFSTKDNKFNKTQKLNYARWYGSVVTLGNEEILIVGGHDKLTNISSIIPEILKKDSNGRLFLEAAQ